MALWTPAEITTSLWLDAADYSMLSFVDDFVSVWADKSGNDLDYGQTTAANRPSYTADAINGKGAVNFPGTSRFLSNASGLTNTAGMAIFMVFSRPSAGGETFALVGPTDGGFPYGPYWYTDNVRYSGISSGTNATHGSASTATGWFLWSYTRATANTCQLYDSGNALGTEQSSGTVGSYLNLIGRRGNSSTTYTTGLISEIIVISEQITTETRQIIEGYLAWKYNFVSSLPTGHPYKDAAPTGGGTEDVLQSWDITYDMGPPDNPVLQSWDITYSGFIQADYDITLPITAEVVAGVACVYGQAWEIVRACEVTYSGQAELVAAVDIGYSTITPVIRDISVAYNLETMTPLLQAVELLYLHGENGESIALSLSLVVAGEELESLTSLSLSRQRSQYTITASADLASMGDYLRCALGAEATLTLNGEEVALIVTGRTRPRSEGDYRYQVSLASPAALLDAPWAETISGDYYGMAADIAGAVSAWPLTWSTIDWPILSGRLQVSAQTPVAVLRQLAGAVGAVVVSEWDGDITIEPDYPLSPSAYASATPAYTVSEAGDVFAADESETVEDYYNAVLISDGQGEAGSGDTIHLEVIDAPDGDGKIVRGWCYPWNRSLTLSHAGGLSVYISREGDEEREESEVITVLSGEGSTRYPVEDVEDHDWQERSLGPITVDKDGKITAAIVGDSLLNITYITRAREWRLRNSGYDEVLIIAEATDSLSGSTAVSVLVVRGLGDSYGPEVQDPLITTDEAGRERGRNLLDRYAARKVTVQLTCPFRSLLRPGALVEVLDLERPRWRGLLTGQSVYIVVNGEDLTAETVLTIEQEVAA